MFAAWRRDGGLLWLYFLALCGCAAAMYLLRRHGVI
jgi:hypothetical protein